MNAQEITAAIGSRKPSHNSHGWMTHEEIAKYKHFFIYGDDGGDLYIRTPDTEAELTKLADQHANGITNCDFETNVYLIVRNGKKVKAKVVLVDDED